MRLAKAFPFIKFLRMNLFRIFFASLLLLGPITLESKDIRLLTEPLTDEVNLLSSEQHIQIRKILAEIEEKTTDQVFVYIIESLEGENLETFSLAVAEKSKIGQFKKDNGVLLLLSTKDKEVRIEVGYGLEGTLTDVLSSRIIRNVMLPIFKQGDLPGGIIMGLLSIQSVLVGEVESIPALQTDHPDGIGISLAEKFTFLRFGLFIIIAVFAFLIHIVLNKFTFYQSKKWLQYVLGIVILVCLAFNFTEMVFYLFFVALGIGNIYFLILQTPKSYLFFTISFLSWIPILQLSFNIGSVGMLFVIIFVVFLSLVFLAIKVSIDDLIIQKLTDFSNRYGTSPMGLLCIIISIASFLFGIYSLIHKETILYSVFYTGLLLFIVNGFAFPLYRIHYMKFLSVLIIWLALISFLYLIEPLQEGLLAPVGSETMVILLQLYICLMIGYILGRFIEVSNWIWRVFKYALIAIIWTIAFHIQNFLTGNFTIDPEIFLISFISMFVLHFLFFIRPYFSGSGSSSSSSGYRGSSSSSRSSGGGGGSFGGGGSSGSW